MWKIKDLMLKHFLLSEICALEICEQFVYKQQNMLKINLLFKIFTRARHLQLHGQITREFLGLRIRNFQGKALYEHKPIERFSNMHKCTFNSIKFTLFLDIISFNFSSLTEHLPAKNTF